MKAAFALLAATTALGAVLALSSTGAGLAANFGAMSVTERTHGATVPSDGMPVLLADNGSDDDDDRQARHGDDDDDEKDDCDTDDDRGRACTPGRNAAPVGTVAPPANGLFGTGPAPQVQVN